MKKYISIIVLSILMPTIIFAGFIEDLDKLFNSLYFWVQDKQETQQNLGAATVVYPQSGGTGTSTIPVKGDLLIGSSSRNYSVLSSSTDYKILTASSSAAYGIGWTSQIGSASNRLDAYLGLADITTLNVGGAASGDLNMGNKDILNANQIKANYFNATSTTATSTFSGGLTAGNNAAFVVNLAASVNALYIDASGNIGINTANPSHAKLQFDNGTGEKINFFYDGTYTHGIDLQPAGLLRYFAGGSTDSIAFGYKTNDVFAEWMRVKSGNFGVGNDSPNSKLTINGGDISISSTGVATTTIFGATTATSTIISGLTVGNNAALVVNQAATANSLYINPSGSIGIGTAAPGTKLDVSGTITATAMLTPRIAYEAGSASFIAGRTGEYLALGANNIEAIRIDTVGHVGIGTTTPASILTVSDTATSTISVYSSSATLGGCVEIEGADGTWAHFITNNSVISSIAGRCE